MTEDIEVPAIHDNDLRQILSHYGIEESMDQGLQTCAYCSRSISWQNLGAIRVSGDTLILYCDFSECLEAASSSED